MKKVILSSSVIILFGIYVFFLKSGDISAQLFKSRPVPVEFTNTDNTVSPTSDLSTDRITRNINCVYIPSDEDNEESYVDDEEAEKKGHYKCTTIIVTPEKVANTTPSIPQTPTKTTPSTPSIPKTPTTPVVVTPPPVIKPKSNSIWKDGTFIGDIVDAYYGNVQVSATISDGKISSISFLDYPQDRSTSLQKSNRAMPKLKSEAIAKQSSNVNTVSGATYTSEAFMMSLSSALTQARI